MTNPRARSPDQALPTLEKTWRDVLNTPVSLAWSVVGIAALLLLGWGWYSSSLLMNVGRLPNNILPGAFGLSYEIARFTAPDGTALSGWFIPAAQPSDATIVVCHGWGGNKADMLPSTVFLRQRGGHNLFYFDFRNHGDSGGRYSSLTTLEAGDLNAALDYLGHERPETSRRLAVYGLSMGGSVALSVSARRTEVRAVAAESPFGSFNEAVARFARLFYGVPRVPLVQVTLLFIRWRLGFDPEPDSPVYHVDKIWPRPVLFIQGDSDPRMPAAEGERLFARAREPKWLWTIPGADHGEIAERAGREYEDRLLSFFQAALRP